MHSKRILWVWGLVAASLSAACDDKEPDGIPPLSDRETVALSSDDARLTVADDGTTAALVYDPAGGVVRITVATTLAWTVETEGLDEWCTVLAAGTGLEIAAGHLAEKILREGEIRILADGKSEARIAVSQQGMGREPAVYFDRQQLTLFDDGDGVQTVALVTNLSEWEPEAVTDDGGEWLSVGKTADGRGIVVSAARNDGPARGATISVRSDEWTVQTESPRIRIGQWGAAMVLEAEVQAGSTVALPLKGEVEVAVAWGDRTGTYATYVRTIDEADRYITYTYPNAGTYRIRVSGRAAAMSYEAYEDPDWPEFVSEELCAPIAAVEQWGCLGFENMRYGLSGTRIRTVPSDPHGFLDGVKRVDGLFRGCASLRSLPEDFFGGMTGIGSFDRLFAECAALETVPAGLFAGAGAGATSFRETFAYSGLEHIPETLFAAAPHAADFAGVFAGCPLTEIPASLFRENREARLFESAFAECPLESVPEELFAASAEARSFAGTFAGTRLAAIPAGLFAANAQAETVAGCFSGIAALIEIPDGLFAGTKGVRDLSDLFAGCERLERVPARLFAGCRSAVYAEGIFRECVRLKSVDADLFDGLAAVESFANAFNGCTALEGIPSGLFSRCTAATDFTYAFQGCTSLKYLPAGVFPVSAEKMPSVFMNCTSLESIAPGAFDALDRVLYLNYAFQNCTSLRDLPEGLFAGCSSCTAYAAMFDGCTSLVRLPERLFNGRMVTTGYFGTQYLFARCTSLKTVPADLFASFVQAPEMNYVFLDCSSLESVPEALFASCPEITAFNSLFRNCTGLKSVPTGIFDHNAKVKNFSRTFSNCSALVGLSPSSLRGGERIRLWERAAGNGFTAPRSHSETFAGATFTDADEIPASWK